MDRVAGLAFLSNMKIECINMSPYAISFDTSKIVDISHGFRIHIKGICECEKQFAKQVAKKHDLSVIDENDDIIIYEIKTVTLIV